MNAALALNPPRIQRIKLPKAFSLSWLMNLVNDHSAAADFKALLRHFAPKVYRKIRPSTQLGAYELLLNWLAQCAPIDDAGALDWEMEIMQDGGELGSGGIPIVLYGFDNYESESPSRAFLARWLNGVSNGSSEFAGVNEFIASLPEPPEAYVDLSALTKGRRWIKPWDGLIEFAQWITGSTGWGVLDYSDGDVDGMPPWNIDEVQSLIEDWTHCEPILERINAFNKWVDEKPDERIPQMARALLGDTETLAAISEPIS